MAGNKGFRSGQSMSFQKVLPMLVALIFVGCSTHQNSDKEIPLFLLKFPPKSFAYPIGENEFVTERNDWFDNWYNSQDFGENRHLGEDWNKNSGGDTDCGEAVYSSADGRIVHAGHAGPGWGNVIIVEHTGSDGTKVRSLYGHLQSITKASGSVARRELIGTVGTADGRYKCHLHFEIRWSENPLWDQVGPGYSDERHGWIDPSEFIEKQRNPPTR